MTQQPETLLPLITAGIHAGAVSAIENARRTGTKLVVWRDNKIVEITAEEAEVMLKMKPISVKEPT